MKSKLIKALVAAAMPTSGLRRAAYRALLNYDIAPSAKIGFGTVIAIKSLKVGERTTIGPLNIFKGPIEATIGSDVKIGRSNMFSSAWHILDPRFKEWNYTPRLVLGDRTLVLNKHFFDIFGLVEIGEGSWIAGYNGEFWTHGLSTMDRDIVIGRDCYIGSSVKFAPGTRIGDRCIVALGSVVFSKIDVEDHLISGFPAKPLRSIAEDRAAGKYRFSFEDW